MRQKRLLFLVTIFLGCTNFVVVYICPYFVFQTKGGDETDEEKKGCEVNVLIGEDN